LPAEVRTTEEMGWEDRVISWRISEGEERARDFGRGGVGRREKSAYKTVTRQRRKSKRTEAPRGASSEVEDVRVKRKSPPEEENFKTRLSKSKQSERV